MMPLHSYMYVALLKKPSCYDKGVLKGSWTSYTMTPLLVVTRANKDLDLGTLHIVGMLLQVSLHPCTYDDGVKEANDTTNLL